MEKEIYKVLFKKIKTNHQKLRTDEVIGYTSEIPSVGKQFILISNPLSIGQEKGFRSISTSPVKEVSLQNKTFSITTESGSKYEIEILEYPKNTQ